MYDVLCEYEIGKGKARANIQAFVAMIEECRMLVDTISIDQLLEKVLEDSGYLDMLREDKEIERLENIKELIGDISDYVEAHPEGTLNEYLQEISLYSDKEEQENGDFVQLMTIHAAKGLEFDNVFVYSLCEGIFPNERSVGEGGQPALEEERRLAYVAFTRAKNSCFYPTPTATAMYWIKSKQPPGSSRSFPRTVSRMSAQNRGIHFPAMSIPSAAVTFCPCTAVTWYSIVLRKAAAMQDRPSEN